MLLAIDTATNTAGIALQDASGTHGYLSWHTERNHTVELVPNIVQLLAQAGTDAAHLGAVAVATGPGSYTGLRIGLSVAKGFCFGHRAALIGIPTFDISAHVYSPRDRASDSREVLCAVIQAGRARLAAAFYQARQDTWQPMGETFFGRADELAEKCANQPTVFVGEVDQASEQVLRERLGAMAHFAPTAERVRDPRVLARLGWERWQRGQTDDVETLAPVYGQ